MARARRRGEPGSETPRGQQPVPEQHIALRQRHVSQRMTFDARVVHDANVAHVTKHLVVVKAISDNKLIRDTESCEVWFEPIRLRSTLLQECRHTHRQWRVRLQKGHELRHCRPRINDVLAEEYVATFELLEIHPHRLNLDRSCAVHIGV